MKHWGMRSVLALLYTHQVVWHLLSCSTPTYDTQTTGKNLANNLSHLDTGSVPTQVWFWIEIKILWLLSYFKFGVIKSQLRVYVIIHKRKPQKLLHKQSIPM